MMETIDTKNTVMLVYFCMQALRKNEVSDLNPCLSHTFFESKSEKMLKLVTVLITKKKRKNIKANKKSPNMYFTSTS